MPSPRQHGAAPVATIYTVAQRAGVSHQTVSRYLKGESLRPANRARVEEAMAALDYRVNDEARALATNTARRIGAIIFDADDWAPQRVLAGAAEAARTAGHILDIVRVDPDDSDSLAGALHLMNKTSLAGVVVISPPDPVLDRLDLDRLGVRWVVEGEPSLVAGGDSALGHPFAQVVEHVADLGHQRFFHVGGPVTWLAARNRALAYTEVLARRGLTDCGRTAGEWGPAAGYAAMASYPVDEAPTAIIAASDQLALGVLFWLREHGFDVPADVSVSGYDGIADAAYYWPPLTTVAVDFADLGRATVRALFDDRQNNGRPALDHPGSRLVVRASTGAPGAGLART